MSGRFLLQPLLLALAFAACRQPDGFREIRAFPSRESLERLQWRCHTVFTDVRDSLSGSGALDVEAFRGDYPGMEWNWLAGDWRGYDSLCFSARLRGADSAAPVAFALSVWDGREPYVPANRFSTRFQLENRWARQCLDIRGEMHTAGGRPLRKRKVSRVAFFAPEAAPPLAFRIGEVRLVKAGKP
jgi:hypothetical protein